MAITKKLRFEVFKRDMFTCQYCGNTPPAIVLEADHIIPKSKGGTDDIDNLMCSCFDCNRGKSNRNLNVLPISTQEKSKLLKEKQIQLNEFYKYQKLIAMVKENQLQDVLDAYYNSFEYIKKKYIPSIRKAIDEIGYLETLDAMEIATSKIYREDDCIRYFFGIVRNRKNETIF